MTRATKNPVATTNCQRQLLELIDASLRLQERIVRLDRMIHEETLYAEAAHPYPLGDHMDRIRAAFTAG